VSTGAAVAVVVVAPVVAVGWAFGSAVFGGSLTET